MRSANRGMMSQRHRSALTKAEKWQTYASKSVNMSYSYLTKRKSTGSWSTDWISLSNWSKRKKRSVPTGRTSTSRWSSRCAWRAAVTTCPRLARKTTRSRYKCLRSSTPRSRRNTTRLLFRSKHWIRTWEWSRTPATTWLCRFKALRLRSRTLRREMTSWLKELKDVTCWLASLRLWSSSWLSRFSVTKACWRLLRRKPCRGRQIWELTLNLLNSAQQMRKMMIMRVMLKDKTSLRSRSLSRLIALRMKKLTQRGRQEISRMTPLVTLSESEQKCQTIVK